MRALRYHGPRDVRVDEVAEPEPGPGQVKVRMSCNGICGTDVHEYYDGPIVHPTQPHPLTGAQIPVGIGHEASGVVSAIGAGANPLLVGTRVAINPVTSCGVCAECVAGETTRCPHFAVLGLSTCLGALAEYVVVDERKVYPLDGSLGLAEATLIEPLAVAHRAVRRTTTIHDGPVLVLGAGPIGLGVLLGLRLHGVERIVACEPSPTRRAAARDLGFEVWGIDEVAPESLRARSGAARGFAAVIDAAGTSSSFTSALCCARPGGTVMLVAIAPGRLEFMAHPLVVAEKSIVSSIIYEDSEFAAVVRNMNDGAYGRQTWYREIELDDYVGEGIEPSRDGTVTKAVVRLR